MNILERYRQPTPRFFRMLRTVGISLASGGAALLAAPVALPAVLLSIAGYAVVAGSVATAVSQAVVADGIAEAKPREADAQ
ncbi:MAG: hypothetical protein CMF35_08035 [Leeuwenhoekiella sp.]|uniref:hypothetical protein n=1 Tax=Leeuwenhoekiella blandensis TaxID=360293 RepID=UPI000C4B60B3|nr:hypothetical protein [Leeuwenhoekiella blandensis]MBQ51632.1 hypothetical protein [Leeuwenhoekiella sp.]|tara:strand:+ start:547 stop:789 length:243 start_codon:yes stop_codon:yes gene_type:complete